MTHSTPRPLYRNTVYTWWHIQLPGYRTEIQFTHGDTFNSQATVQKYSLHMMTHSTLRPLYRNTVYTWWHIQLSGHRTEIQFTHDDTFNSQATVLKYSLHMATHSTPRPLYRNTVYIWWHIQLSGHCNEASLTHHIFNCQAIRPFYLDKVCSHMMTHSAVIEYHQVCITLGSHISVFTCFN